MTGLTKVGSRVVVSGVLTKDSVEGTRTLLELLQENGASFEVLDASQLKDIDAYGVQLISEFQAARPDVHVALPVAVSVPEPPTRSND